MTDWEICIKDVQLTNVQQLCGAHMLTKISEETFQHLVESLKARGGPTQIVPNKMSSERVISMKVKYLNSRYCDDVSRVLL